MQQIDETLYIKRILAGETELFAHFVDRYSHQIYSLIVKIVRSREDAEEMAQDVFVKAFQVLGSFKGDCKFSSWLYRIAYNIAISATRKKKHEFLYIEEQTINNVLDEKIEEALEECDNAEQLLKLRKAVELLSPDERGVITLFYMDEHSIEEVSSITGISVANVKVKLHRIRKKLYVIINDMKE